MTCPKYFVNKTFIYFIFVFSFFLSKSLHLDMNIYLSQKEMINNIAGFTVPFMTLSSLLHMHKNEI